MRLAKTLLACCALAVASVPVAAEGPAVLDAFEGAPETRWRFFADTVMGGVSTGQVAFLREDQDSFARMTGAVSTANNGGFIQVRTELDAPLPREVQGVRLIARGNGQMYFVHLRTKGTMLPWQYYQAAFMVGETWSEFRLPLTTFQRSGGLLREVPAPGAITSLGIVAFGRDHAAQIDVREVGFY